MMSIKLTDPPAGLRHPADDDAFQRSIPWADHLLARLLAALCLATAVLAGAASLTGVVEGTAWFPPLVLPVLAVHLASGIARGIRFLRWAAFPAAIAVALVSLLQHPAMELNHFGRTAWQWSRTLFSEAGMQLATQVPPVANSVYIAFTILVLVLAVSLVAELLASFRHLALLVVIPVSFAPIIASLFKPQGAGIAYLALLLLALLGYVALIPHATAGRTGPAGQAMPPAQALGVLGLAATACIGALLAASLWMPGFRSGMLPEGQRPSGDLLASNIDPLIDLGRDLRANSGEPILAYYTTAEQAPYLRTEVIKDLASERWEPSEDLIRSNYAGDTAMATNFSMFNSSQEVLRMLWPAGVASPVLPLPDRSYFVQGIQGDWNWIYETSAARLSGDALAATGELSVAYAPLEISAQMVRSFERVGIDSVPQLPEEYLQLPQDPDNSLEPLLQRTLREAYDGESAPRTDLGKAVALQDFFRAGNFVYSELTPLREGYDGANRQVVEAFLERRQGYCVHFASAMALLAREAGIPSRIVVGYAPGVASGDELIMDESTAQSRLESQLEEGTRLTGYTVSGQQAHAWPELYLNGLGWIPFEPTPGRGYAPSYAPEPTRTLAPGQSTAPEVPTARSVPGDSPATAPSAEATGSSPTNGVPEIRWLLPVLAVLAALGLCLAPWRRRRLRHERLEQVRRGGPGAAPALLAELKAIGADAGAPAGAHESVGDYALRLGEDHPQASEQLQLLKAAVQESFYAGRHPAAGDSKLLLAALEDVKDALRRGLPAGQRLRCLLLPASLRPRHAATEHRHRAKF